ncbi:hypothetical protein [Sphingomonas adhaesiva]|uniref:hypothetical protein n=1 Tax=Sphingomonas adhaesiva TaxID=28212 RepID=UPI002FF4665C
MRAPGAIAAWLGDRRPVVVEDGQSGAEVFRVDGDCFLKVGRGPAAPLVADEAARLAWLSGRVPAARIVAAVEE